MTPLYSEEDVENMRKANQHYAELHQRREEQVKPETKSGEKNEKAKEKPKEKEKVKD